MRINKSAARAELEYRSLPKPRPARKSLQAEGEIFHKISRPQQALAFQAGTAELRTLLGVAANVKATAPAKAPKARKAKTTRPAKVKSGPSNETLLRQEAWAMRNAAKDAGDKLTYEQACAILGVVPARQAA